MAISIVNKCNYDVTVSYPNGTYTLKKGKEMSTDYKGKFLVIRSNMVADRCEHPLSNGAFKITSVGLQAVYNGKVLAPWTPNPWNY